MQEMIIAKIGSDIAPEIQALLITTLKRHTEDACIPEWIQSVYGVNYIDVWCAKYTSLAPIDGDAKEKNPECARSMIIEPEEYEVIGRVDMPASPEEISDKVKTFVTRHRDIIKQIAALPFNCGTNNSQNGPIALDECTTRDVPLVTMGNIFWISEEHQVGGLGYTYQTNKETPRGIANFNQNIVESACRKMRLFRDGRGYLMRICPDVLLVSPLDLMSAREIAPKCGLDILCVPELNAGAWFVIDKAYARNFGLQWVERLGFEVKIVAGEDGKYIELIGRTCVGVGVTDWRFGYCGNSGADGDITLGR